MQKFFGDNSLKTLVNGHVTNIFLFTETCAPLPANVFSSSSLPSCSSAIGIHWSSTKLHKPTMEGLWRAKKRGPHQIHNVSILSIGIFGYSSHWTAPAQALLCKIEFIAFWIANVSVLYDYIYKLGDDFRIRCTIYSPFFKMSIVYQMNFCLSLGARFQKKILFTSVVGMYTNRKAFILRLSFISILLDQKYHLRSNTNILFTARILFFRFNYDPSVQIPAKTFENPKVSGQNRYKYFRRPIIPFLQQVPPEVLLQPTT